MIEIFVIGCASLDTLHIAGQTYRTIGGAGLYTALAAARAGADATLFAPRSDPVPEPFSAAANLIRWAGPRVPPAEMPRLEIEHHGGGRATLLDAAWGAESQLTPELLGSDLSQYQNARKFHVSPSLESLQRISRP